ncbi:MAG: hypothetical protein ACRDN6_02315 [Gaiellaceae bacterium]
MLRGSPLVAEAGEDFAWKALDDPAPGLPFEDPASIVQWDMMQIRAPEAHVEQEGLRAVDVGILDSGIDGSHIEFDDDGIPGGATNVDCKRGRDFVPLGPGVGNPSRASTTSSRELTSPAPWRRSRTTSASWASRRT